MHRPFAPAAFAALSRSTLGPAGPGFETAGSAGGGAGGPLGDLPTWDFTGLYAEPAEPKIDADLTATGEAVKKFADAYEGKLASLSGAQMLAAIEAYERIDDTLGRVMSYVGLRYQQDSSDPERAKALGDAQGRVTDLTAPLVFFELEINRLDDDALEAMFASSEGLARYRPFFDQLRAFRPHQLSDELEKYLHDKSVVGVSAWNRLFDETMASLEFTVGEGEAAETLALEPTLTRLTDADRSKREAASKALSASFAKNIRLFSRITNTLTKEKEISDRWRKHPTPENSRHLANQVEPEVVDALRQAVQDAYPRLSHRYYALKAGWLGLDKLKTWDRNAPLPKAAERAIPWGEARETVLGAYAEFAPEMADIASRFFEEGWIDAPVRPGKSPGAFAHPTVTSAHPFVMLNYLGKTRDVMTLAHELGHGVHQVLAARQGELLSRTPLTLAETASVFGEMLTFKRLLAGATDPVKRKTLLAGKVEDMINTVVRQIAFYEFELRLHRARREGELTPDAIGEIWMAVQTESLGPAFEFDEDYRNFWAYIPHFIHSPFYVYAYAFGDGLVNALYAVYQEREATGDAGFQPMYFDMLRAGGSKRHKELLAPFGLDASDPEFWQKGLGVIEGMISELEAMEG